MDRHKKYRRDMLNTESSFIETNAAKEKIRSSPKFQEIKKDSEKRVEIQNTITKMAKEGKGKLEILTYLMNKFQDPEKSKYYGIWIDNKFKHLKIKDIDSEQER